MLPPLPRRSAALVLIVFCWLLAASQASASTPVISGKPIVTTSETLDVTGSATVTSLDYVVDEPVDIESQWLLCSSTGGSCTALLGENQETIDFRMAWVDKTLRVRVTIYNQLDRSQFASATSDPVGPIVSAGDAPFGAIIAHGSVQMGVNRTGELIVGGGERAAAGSGSTKVGIRYAPLNLESISDGSLAEGWGVADPDSGADGLSGWANRDLGGPSDQIREVGFAYTANSADSTANLVDDAENPVLRVEHNYQPSSSTHLFEATVTITNETASTIAHTKYRRVVDWDIEPTPFQEYVTIAKGNSPALIDASDDGFSPSNPLLGLGACDHGHGDVIDSGPHDCGAAFDFDFGSLAPGASKVFKLYYGAAGNEAEAMDALQSVGAEAYSLGQSSTDLGATAGTPATFVLAFSGIGGDSLFSDDPATPDTIIDSRPAMHGQDDTPEFAFHSDDAGAGFQCSLDGADWDACASPLTSLGSVSEGWHNFRVRAVLFNDIDPEQIDATDPTPAAANFKYDVTAPDTNIVQVGAEAAVTSAPKFKFESADGDPQFEVTFECTVDAGPPTDCTDGLELSGVSLGPHSLAATATDRAGNVEDPPATLNWTYAILSPPVTTITTTGGQKTTDDVKIEFAATGDVENYHCSLDGSNFSLCSSPYEISDLDVGDHLFEVYATDVHGQQELTPKQLAFSFSLAQLLVPPTKPAPNASPLAPTVKLGKPNKKGVAKLTATCNEAVCTLTAYVKIGKKKYKLKGKVLTKGTSTVDISFNKKLKKALKQKHRKKAALTVVLSSPAGSATVTKKF
jgi:hypothetical protein